MDAQRYSQIRKKVVVHLFSPSRTEFERSLIESMASRPIHLQVAYVQPNGRGGGSIGAALRYIQRCAEKKRPERLPIAGTSCYVTRAERLEGGETDVADVRFFCRGSHRSADIWAAVDKAFRTKAGEYSHRGGSARMALFVDATLPRELSEEQKLLVGSELAEDLVARYRVCVEAAWHVKAGRIDHFHLLVSTRAVDEDGVGKIVREFNGISSKCSGGAVIDSKKKLAGHMEWMRTQYAAILTRETGQLFDARSYERQNSDIEPVRYISRQRIEAEKKQGMDTWREERRAKIAARQIFAGGIGHRIEVPKNEEEEDRRPQRVAQSTSSESAPMRSETRGIPTSSDSVTRAASPSVPLQPLLELASLALSVENDVQLRNQQAPLPPARPRRGSKMEDNYAGMVCEVDEQNRREAAQDLAQQKAERDAAAQRQGSDLADLARWLPPPLHPQTLTFGTTATRRAAAHAAAVKDRLAKRDINWVQATPRHVITRVDDPEAGGAAKNMSAGIEAVAEPAVSTSGPLAGTSGKCAKLAESSSPASLGSNVGVRRETPPADYAVRRLKARLANATRSATQTPMRPSGQVEQASHAGVEQPLGAIPHRAHASQNKLGLRNTPPVKNGAMSPIDEWERERAQNDVAGTKPALADEKPRVAPPESAPQASVSPHHHDFISKPEERPLSREFLIRLAALLQISQGGLAPHRHQLANLAGLDLEAFALSVAIQSAANTAPGMPPLLELKRQLIDEIENGTRTLALETAFQALSRRSEFAKARSTSPDQSKKKGPGIGA